MPAWGLPTDQRRAPVYPPNLGKPWGPSCAQSATIVRTALQVIVNASLAATDEHAGRLGAGYREPGAPCDPAPPLRATLSRLLKRRRCRLVGRLDPGGRGRASIAPPLSRRVAWGLSGDPKVNTPDINDRVRRAAGRAGGKGRTRGCSPLSPCTGSWLRLYECVPGAFPPAGRGTGLRLLMGPGNGHTGGIQRVKQRTASTPAAAPPGRPWRGRWP